MKKVIIAFMISLSIILLILGFQQEQKDIEHIKVNSDYNKKIADYMFDIYISKKILEGDKLTNWYDEVKYMKSDDLLDLKQYFLKYDCNLNSLKSFELLVSNRIYDDSDYFGTDIINGGTFTNRDLTIIITSGQNLLDQLQIDNYDRLNLKAMEDAKQSELEKYTIYKFQSQLFMLIVALVFIMLFLYVSDYKK